jgi:hypothetical protein
MSTISTIIVQTCYINKLPIMRVCELSVDFILAKFRHMLTRLLAVYCPFWGGGLVLQGLQND